MQDVISLFIKPVLKTWGIFAKHIPSLIAALLLILFGIFVARLLRSVVEHFFKKMKFDNYTSRIGINEIMARFGFGKSPTYIIGFVLYWSLILVFFVAAFDMLHLPIVAKILERLILEFMPKIASAILIGFGGLLFARVIAEIVLNSATANNLKGGKALSKIVNFVVLVFTAIVALEQIGIEMKIIRSSLNIFLGAIGLAFAIAVGLGAKDTAKDIIHEMLTESKTQKKE